LRAPRRLPPRRRRQPAFRHRALNIMTSAAAASSCSAEEALARARDCLDAGDDDNAAKLVELSLQKAPAATNPQAAVLKEWLVRFGKGSAADTTVRRVLACPAGDFYAVVGAPRFQEPPRQEYLKLSLLLHPDVVQSWDSQKRNQISALLSARLLR
jgi:hypothetical protein